MDLFYERYAWYGQCPSFSSNRPLVFPLQFRARSPCSVPLWSVRHLRDYNSYRWLGHPVLYSYRASREQSRRSNYFVYITPGKTVPFFFIGSKQTLHSTSSSPPQPQLQPQPHQQQLTPTPKPYHFIAFTPTRTRTHAHRPFRHDGCQAVIPG